MVLCYRHRNVLSILLSCSQTTFCCSSKQGCKYLKRRDFFLQSGQTKLWGKPVNIGRTSDMWSERELLDAALIIEPIRGNKQLSLDSYKAILHSLSKSKFSFSCKMDNSCTFWILKVLLFFASEMFTTPMHSELYWSKSKVKGLRLSTRYKTQSTWNVSTESAEDKIQENLIWASTNRDTVSGNT